MEDLRWGNAIFHNGREIFNKLPPPYTQPPPPPNHSSPETNQITIPEAEH